MPSLFVLFLRKVMTLFREPLAGRLTSPFVWTRPVWDMSLHLASKCSRISRCWQFRSRRPNPHTIHPRPVRAARIEVTSRIPHRLPLPRTRRACSTGTVRTVPISCGCIVSRLRWNRCHHDVFFPSCCANIIIFCSSLASLPPHDH